MFLVRNTVYDNQNNIPFYNPSHEPEDRTSNPPDYGTSDQTYIIDGSGTYCKVASSNNILLRSTCRLFQIAEFVTRASENLGATAVVPVTLVGTKIHPCIVYL